MLRWLLIAGVTIGCGCGDESVPSQPPPQRPPRQVPEPSRSAVRALPPHEIHVDGVGPYLLETPLRGVLARLPHGPRVELVEIPGVVDYSLVRAEAGKLVIGVEKPGGVEFISVLATDIARTAAGVGVGSAVSALAEKHGARISTSSMVADAALYRPATLPGSRFVLNGGRVDAVVVGPPPEVSLLDRPCMGREEQGFRKRLMDSVGKTGADVSVACLEGGRGAVTRDGDRVTVLSEAPGGDAALKKVAVTTTPSLRLAGPLDVDGDGLDELAMVAVATDGDTTKVTMTIADVIGNRIVPSVRTQVYTAQAAPRPWYGNDGAGQFLLELTAKQGVVTVSGLYVQRGGAGVRDVMPLLPRTFVVSTKRAPPDEEPRDGGVGGSAP